jgi:predicted methyltransferase
MKLHLTALVTAGLLISSAGHAQLADTVVAGSDIDVPASFAAAVASDRRSDDEKARDANRHPGKVMAFFGVEEGDTVAEIMTSGGYYVGVLSEIVGPRGTVYGHNNGWIMQRQEDGRSPIAKRIDKVGHTNVVNLVGEIEDPGLPEGELDAVFIVLIYHDMLGLFETDTAAANAAIMKALKPGGVYGIIDHHAAPGAGLGATRSVHRVERAAVVQDIMDAGFEFVAETDLLENLDDDLSKSVFTPGTRGNTHRMVLKFRKPE